MRAIHFFSYPSTPTNALEQLLKEATLTEFKPDEEEEFEDADGNVFSKKTFEELKKQGLLRQ